MWTLVILIFSCLFFYFVGYRFYAGRLDRDLVQPDADFKTPAVSQNDGVDYVPSKPVVLFGHNFASIAGAGPVIGPIIAMHHFGWALTLVWILLGNVFIGAVHDYLALTDNGVFVAISASLGPMSPLRVRTKSVRGEMR